MASNDVTKTLEQAGVPYELLEHRRTESGLTEAFALGASTGEVAKTLVLGAPSGHVRALIPASERIDMRKVADVLGENRHDVHLTGEAEMARDYPEFELGAVPPLAGPGHDRVLVDTRLVRGGTVVFEAGSHIRSVRVDTSDLVRLTGAETADICLEG